jgi:DNA-directed RNA polymerase specialized sigma24 family protein
MCIASLADAQREFTAHLPAVLNATRYAFRRYRLRRHDFEDISAEAIAACWSSWLGIISRGRSPLEVGVCGIANQAVRYVRSGKRLANTNEGRHKMDIHHRRARRLGGGYKVVSYDTGPAERNDVGPAAWCDWVATDHRMGPADAAAFNIDYSAWLAGLPERRRQTALLLAEGRGTLEVAGLVGVTPAAVSQARSYLDLSLKQHVQEPAAASN